MRRNSFFFVYQFLYFFFMTLCGFDDYPVNIGFSDSGSPADFRGIHVRGQRRIFLG